MASQARIDANRRNALQSTGPRTERGKARSCANALRDGFFCQKVHLRDQAETEEFALLRRSVLASLRPADAMQQWCAEQIVIQQWKLRLLQAIVPPEEADEAWEERQEKRQQRVVNLILKLMRELRTLKKAQSEEEKVEDVEVEADWGGEGWNEANGEEGRGGLDGVETPVTGSEGVKIELEAAG